VTSLVFVSFLQFLFVVVALSSALWFVLFFSNVVMTWFRLGTIVGLDFIMCLFYLLS
jgi:hypothetical protein